MPHSDDAATPWQRLEQVIDRHRRATELGVPVRSQGADRRICDTHKDTKTANLLQTGWCSNIQ
jgi:hypothetical protein